jgi:hypothetical protein
VQKLLQKGDTSEKVIDTKQETPEGVDSGLLDNIRKMVAEEGFEPPTRGL